jgi:alpha-beta hydrolase superfamily lysophospholipase
MCCEKYAARKKQTMKLVLLPGMDGTGILFKDFIDTCHSECQIISLPQNGSQTYQDLALAIQHHIPEEEYVLLAESFSGALIPLLLNQVKRKPVALILVASFLHSPRPILLRITQFLPLSLLLSMPGAKAITKYFCMKGASVEQFNQFWSLVKSLDKNLLKERLMSIQNMRYQVDVINLPTLCLIAKNDKLVPKSISIKLVDHFSDIKIKTLTGPHFILQTNARDCVAAINSFIECRFI